MGGVRQISLKEFPYNWSKLRTEQVEAYIADLSNQYRKYGVTMPRDNRVRIGKDVSMVWNSKFEWYTINGRLVTPVHKRLYGPVDALFKACKAYRHSDEWVKSTRRKEQISKVKEDVPETRAVSSLVLVFCVGVGGLLTFGVLAKNWDKTIQNMVNEQKKEYPNYLEYERALEKYEDSLRKNIGIMVNERKKEYPNYLEYEDALKRYEDSLKQNVSIWPWRREPHK